MDSKRRLIGQACRCTSFVAAITISLIPAASFADGSHVAQKAGPGDIVLIRNVAARPADRNPTAPGLALMVNTSPNPQLNSAINGDGGLGEMTDSEIAGLTSNAGASAGSSNQNNVQHALTSALGVNSGGSTGTANNGVSNLVSGASGAAGAVTDNTRNIGDQITNAMSQMPMLGASH
ncbi:hypothetical protein [Dyella mobilis]|uniref:Fap n=1 Tax=Dyella mobilis TaxID=1849582 RepID=A0ABS2KD08_9GAMM|nr:hypothetical protein [Dyella mobilis]MBM7129063.1 hypothetical protein [Dyella mobilis]GLQ98357.1 hypothetical protein GCM10007863_27770 [Dyella mobilis]